MAFQKLLSTQPADPTTTYNGLIKNGVSWAIPSVSSARRSLASWALSSSALTSLGRRTELTLTPLVFDSGSPRTAPRAQEATLAVSLPRRSRLRRSSSPAPPFPDWDACTKTPFLFSPTTKRWISYDDASSIGAKALFARSRGLAGVVSLVISLAQHELTCHSSQNFYDSTGPSGALYDAALKGLKGRFSKLATRKRSLPDEPWRLNEEEQDEDDFVFAPELAAEEEQ
jgi:hypothetical protein